MLRKLIGLLIVLVLLLAGAGVVSLVYIDSITKTAIEKGGTYALGVQTTVGAADVRIREESLHLRRLSVANPEGYADRSFLDVGEGSVEVTLASLREDTVEVPQLVLDGVDVHLEKRKGKANYEVIIDNLKRLRSGKQEPETTDGDRKYVIREVVVRNINVSATLLPLEGDLTRTSIPIGEIRLRDVGSEGGGLRIEQLIGTVVQAIFTGILQSGGKLPGDMMNGLGGALGGLGELGGQLVTGAGQTIQGAADTAGQVLEGAGKTLEDVGKGIGGLLGQPAKPKDDDEKKDR